MTQLCQFLRVAAVRDKKNIQKLSGGPVKFVGRQNRFGLARIEEIILYTTYVSG